MGGHGHQIIFPFLPPPRYPSSNPPRSSRSPLPMSNAPTPNSDLPYADTLWKAADALRGQVDAAEYKHVVLGLLFLKYISDSFESRREKLQTDLEKEGIKGKQLETLL